jgi:hypothetical protein
MALTIASGVDGAVAFLSSHVLKFDTWTGRYGQRVNNITGFDSGGYEENLGGLKFGEGSATGHFKYGTTTTAPGSASFSKTGGTATFTVATGCTISHSTIVSDLNISSDVNGAARGSFNWRATGTITETWAVS